jgi:hypothetical protein
MFTPAEKTGVGTFNFKQFSWIGLFSSIMKEYGS